MTPQVVIHTDGACSGNPGPGGWGAVLHYGSSEKELWGGELATTNNRMELMAAIQALEALKRPCRVELHTDSQYVRNGIREWIHSWKARGWKTADRKPVKNEDLWCGVWQPPAAIRRTSPHAAAAPQSGRRKNPTLPADIWIQPILAIACSSILPLPGAFLPRPLVEVSRKVTFTVS